MGAASPGEQRVHLPLGDFLACFAGLTLQAAEELDDGLDYPRTIALGFAKPGIVV